MWRSIIIIWPLGWPKNNTLTIGAVNTKPRDSSPLYFICAVCVCVCVGVGVGVIGHIRLSHPYFPVTVPIFNGV